MINITRGTLVTAGYGYADRYELATLEVVSIHTGTDYVCVEPSEGIEVIVPLSDIVAVWNGFIWVESIGRAA